MELEVLIPVILLGVSVLVGIVALIVALVKGDIKKFIEEKMVEAEKLYKDLQQPEKSKQKLSYVLEAVNEKYKIMALLLNCKKFIEHIVDLSKKINAK